MLIRSLEIEGFRSHLKSRIEFGRLNLVLGPNAAGKSSILDAIGFALTGACRGTDEGGRGSDALVTLGTAPEGLRVALETDRGRFQRSLEHGPASKVGQAIRDALGFRHDALRAIFRPESFVYLEPKQQADLFASLAAPENIEEVCRQYLGDHLPAGVIPQTMKELDALQVLTQKERPEIKRALAALGPVELKQEAMPADVRAMSPQQIRDRLAEARRQLQALRDQQAGATAAPPEAGRHDELADVDREIERLRQHELKPCPYCKKEIVLVKGSQSLHTPADVSSVMKTLQDLRDKVRAKAKPEAPPAAAPVDPLAERIARGEQYVRDLDRVVFVLDQNAQMAERAAAETRALARAEEILRIIGPKGPLRAALVERGQKGDGFDLLAAINRVTAAAGWGAVTIRPNPWSLLYRNRPIRLLSRSERWRFSLAVQAALASASGVKVLVLDDAEILVGDQRGALAAAIVAGLEAGFYEQAIICASKSLPEIAPPPVGWTALVVADELGDGVSKVVALKGAA